MRLPPEAYQAIWRAVCQIPGVTLSHVTGDPTRAPGMGWDVGIDGWSQTLHAISIEWSAGVDPGAPETLGTRIVQKLQSHIAVQSRRSREGLEAGTALPFKPGDGYRRIVHAIADRTAIGCLIAEADHHGWTRAAMVRTRILRPHDELHQGAVDHGGGRYLSNDSICVVDEMGERFLQLHATLPLTKVGLVGEVMTINSPRMPETVLTAATGRRVGDLVAVHPLVDERIVSSATNHDGFVSITLVPDRIRISDVLDGADDKYPA